MPPRLPITARPVTFRAFGRADAALLHGWLQQPHVRAFWDDGERELHEVTATYFAPDRDTQDFVVLLAGRAAGFLQTYPVEPDDPYGAWRGPTGETWGVDLLLGEVADTGRGVGPEVLRAFLAFWRSRQPGTRRVLIDPDVRNARALSAFRRAGFRPLGEHSDGKERFLLMAVDV